MLLRERSLAACSDIAQPTSEACCCCLPRTGAWFNSLAVRAQCRKNGLSESLPWNNDIMHYFW